MVAYDLDRVTLVFGRAIDNKLDETDRKGRRRYKTLDSAIMSVMGISAPPVVVDADKFMAAFGIRPQRIN